MSKNNYKRMELLSRGFYFNSISNVTVKNAFQCTDFRYMYAIDILKFDSIDGHRQENILLMIPKTWKNSAEIFVIRKLNKLLRDNNRSDKVKSFTYKVMTRAGYKNEKYDNSNYLIIN